jgi:DNA-binding beta-propeller fold protein YncE
MWKIALLLPLATVLLADKITTIAGNGQPGFSATQINNPYGMTIGPDGALYFCEIGNHVVRRLDLKTHEMTVIAGNGTKGYSGDGGPATEAQFNEPYAASFDSLGNLYIADMQNGVVRRVDSRTKKISTLATGFKQPHCLALTVSEDLLVCDIGNKRIQEVDLESGVATTFMNQSFAGPRAIVFDPGGQMYLALRDGNAVGRIKDAFVPFATVKSPKDISYARDYSMFAADSENHRIVNINLVSGTIVTAVGTGEKGDGPDGDAMKCKLARPHGVLAASDGSVYIADSENHRIRKLMYTQAVY